MAASPYSQIVRNDTVAVDTASVTVSEPKPRMTWYAKNTGATTITLNFGRSAVANTAIVLAPGDAAGESANEGYVPYDGTITAIGSGAGGTLSFFEK